MTEKQMDELAVKCEEMQPEELRKTIHDLLQEIQLRNEAIHIIAQALPGYPHPTDEQGGSPCQNPKIRAPKPR